MKIVKKGVILLVFLLNILLVSGSLDISLGKVDYGPGERFLGNFTFSFTSALNYNTPVVVEVDGTKYEDILDNLVPYPSYIEQSYSASSDPSLSVTYQFAQEEEKTIAAIDLSDVDDVEKVVFNVTGLKYGNSDYPNTPSILIGDPSYFPDTVWTYVGPLIPSEFSLLNINYLRSLLYNTEFGIAGNYDDTYCEEVELNPSSKYRINAKVKKTIETGGKLIGIISDDEYPSSCSISNYDPDGNVQCCELKNIGTSFKDVNCIVDRNKGGKAFLCISTDGGDSGKEYYKIAAESDDTIVKGYYNGQRNIKYDYFIWGEYNKFKTNLSDTVNISGFEDLLNYHKDRNILVPITIKTKGPGSVKLDKLDATVIKGGRQHITKFTPITYIPKKINPNSFVYNLGDLDLVTPFEYGDDKILKITIGDDSKTIKYNIKEIPEAIIFISSPRVNANQPVLFSASESFSPSNSTLVSYNWSFGDGNNGTGVEVSHTYTDVGEYETTLNVKDENGLEGKDSFIIQVGSLSESLGFALNSTAKLLGNTKKTFDESEDYVRDTVKVLGLLNILEDANAKLVLLNDQYDASLGYEGSLRESKLANVQNSLSDLLDIVPLSIAVDRVEYPANIVSLNDIPDASVLRLNESVDYDSFKQSLINYNQEITVKGDGRFVLVTYMSGRYDEFILIKKEIKSSKTLKGRIYEYMKGEAEVKEILTEGYEAVSPNLLYKWPISEDIYYTLNTTDVHIVIDLKTFVLPPLKDLEITGVEIGAGFDCGNNKCDYAEDEISCPLDCKKKYPIGFIIFLVILTVAGILYINFYHGPFNFKTIGQDIKNLIKGKPKLFKSKEDLIKLIGYIRKSISRGMTEQQIKFVLKKRGWTDAQIDEVFKRANIKR